MLNKRLFIQAALAVATAGAFTTHAQEAIKVGVTAGPHAQLMEHVKKVAAKDGLNIQIIEFSDYVQPNAALASGDLHANSYQHQPYLDAQIKDRGYKFVKLANTVNFPIGLYSKKVKTLEALPQGAKFGIPNDPTNGGRVLLLLQDKGLIQLKPNVGLKATPLDVVSNPKKLRFVELDAAQLPRSLDDLDASAINTNFAISAGLNPKTDAITLERADNPYVNIMVVREGDQNKAWATKLVKAYHDASTKEFIDATFKGSVFPSF